MPPRARFGPLVVLVVLAGCRGELLATADLRGPGTATAKFYATGKKLALWADTDAKWRGSESSHPVIDYDIEVRQGGKQIATLSCSIDPLGGTSVCGSHTDIMGRHDADCEIALRCALPALSPGETELRVTGRPGANVIAVKKMSLNVRAD